MAWPALPSDRVTVLPGIGSGAVNPIERAYRGGLRRCSEIGITLKEDGLQAADAAIGSIDGMTQRLECRPDESQQVRLRRHGARTGGALVMGVARRVRRRLRVESQIDHVHQMRGMRVRLNCSL